MAKPYIPSWFSQTQVEELETFNLLYYFSNPWNPPLTEAEYNERSQHIESQEWLNILDANLYQENESGLVRARSIKATRRLLERREKQVTCNWNALGIGN